MKTVTFTILVIALLGIAASMATAADFTLTASGSGLDWTYNLANNSASINVIGWSMGWNPTDPADDLAQAQANFSAYNGYPPPIPGSWYDVGGYFPYFGVDDGHALTPGTSLGGFKVHYIGTTHPTYFTISYMSGQDYITSAKMQIEGIVPEPGSAAALAAGLLGCGTLLRRRRS